jgi:ribosome biogenesis protein Tsr3
MSNFRVDDTKYFSTVNYKFKKEGLYLNILLANNPVNGGGLKYKWSHNYYEVNSVLEIIQAKVSYGRPKDLSDLILLKNENFNLK